MTKLIISYNGIIKVGSNFSKLLEETTKNKIQIGITITPYFTPTTKKADRIIESEISI